MRLTCTGIIVLFFSILASCSYYPEEEDFKIEGISSLPSVEALINSNSVNTPEERLILTEQVLKKIKEANKNDLAPVLLQRMVSLHPDDPYQPWYLYTAARINEEMGRKETALFLYRRVYQSPNDINVGDDSVKYLSIQKLIELDSEPYFRIELYRCLLDNFKSRIDSGLTWYYLAQAYETAGLFKDSFAAYRSYLTYPDTVVPQKPNEEKRIQEMLMVSGTKKNWTRSSLDQLLREIRYALEAQDSDKFVSLQSKVNFFAMSWLQEKTDFNSQDSKVTNNLKRFLETSKHVYTESELDSSSNSREAYLKTWGWNTYIPTWFLYFRRVNYPADPDINGNWEWAGIYFGDSLQ